MLKGSSILSQWPILIWIWCFLDETYYPLSGFEPAAARPWSAHSTTKILGHWFRLRIDNYIKKPTLRGFFCNELKIVWSKQKLFKLIYLIHLPILQISLVTQQQLLTQNGTVKSQQPFCKRPVLFVKSQSYFLKPEKGRFNNEEGFWSDFVSQLTTQ